MANQHDVVSDIRRVASELGKPPSRDQYIEHGRYGKRVVERLFGSFTVAKQACGFKEETPREKRAKIDRWFEQDLGALKHTETNLKPPFLYTPTICWGDLHEPFSHDDAISLALAMTEKLPSKRIIFYGDAYDFYSWAKFPRSHTWIDPKTELLEGRRKLEWLFRTVQKIKPDNEIYLIRGNHGMRPHKRVLESSCPELEVFMDIDKWFEFDGVKTIHDPREPLILDDIVHTHGHLSGIGKHMIAMGMPVVHGHTHHGGLVHKKVNGIWLWEMDVGYLGDPEKKCFHYTPSKINNWTRGLGYISEFGPHWFPFE